jgi:hypothetical protein
MRSRISSTACLTGRAASSLVLIVAYDLHNPGRDYPAIEKVLKSATAWAHPQGSVWFLDTLDDCSVWRDRLMKAGDMNDEFFVAQMRKHWAERNIGKRMTEWLKDPQRRW